ncbi:hypothetical protein NDU88_006225 [Pleurodeles waltl]|uniref:Uncharacterized protein n=1 Tax=Pleurodeles waltl TaxID=8319 RepID=A0AAV7WE67_PLEWA|nr:hypothetical protein NDU88_006225 [Pleurodeles waltl]
MSPCVQRFQDNCPGENACGDVGTLALSSSVFTPYCLQRFQGNGRRRHVSVPCVQRLQDNCKRKYSGKADFGVACCVQRFQGNNKRENQRKADVE